MSILSILTFIFIYRKKWNIALIFGLFFVVVDILDVVINKGKILNSNNIIDILLVGYSIYILRKSSSYPASKNSSLDEA